MTDTAWLLESAIPTIRYATRRDLLGLPDGDPCLLYTSPSPRD